jgi:hypothetical protein
MTHIRHALEEALEDALGWREDAWCRGLNNMLQCTWQYLVLLNNTMLFEKSCHAILTAIPFGGFLMGSS